MRFFVVLVFGVVIAVVAALVYSRFGQMERATESAERLTVSSEHLEKFEKRLRDIEGRIMRLEAVLAAMEDRSLLPNEPPLPKSTSIPAIPTGKDTKPVMPSGGDESKPDAVAQGDTEKLRQLIREEIKREKEEEIRRWQEQSKEAQPEDWEKQEFGNYAWYVHNRGRELNLTEQQKRQYYNIIKDYFDKARTLWEELRKSNPNADWQKLGELYKERYSEMTKATREQVLRILDAEQQKKYRDLFNDNEWYW